MGLQNYFPFQLPGFPFSFLVPAQRDTNIVGFVVSLVLKDNIA